MPPTLINFYPNDPAAQGGSPIQVPFPEPTTPGFTIDRWDGKPGLFPPGTPGFDAVQLYVALSHTVKSWESLFAAPFSRWQSTSGPLRVVPRAGKDFNAYYDRHSLRFFYNQDPQTGQIVYAGESLDIAAHEAGHAILDAYHPEYWDSLHPETPAFHEAFGDCSAILTTLGDSSVREAMLSETDGKLDRSNLVSRLAEQLGQAIFHLAGPRAAPEDSLRNAVNQFRYRPPENLPPDTPQSRLSAEPHNFSRIFTGAFYDILIGIYNQLRTQAAADAALAQAREDAGKILARGIELVPPGEATYQTVAIAMFKAVRQNFGDQYFSVLRNAFVRRRILRAKIADAFKPPAGVAARVLAPTFHARSSGEGVRLLPAPPEIDLSGVSARAARFELPEDIKAVLELPRDVTFSFDRSFTAETGEEVLKFAATREIRVEGPEYGEASGCLVQVSGGLSLQTDVRGRLVATHQVALDQRDLAATQENVKKLVATQSIHFTQPGETVSLDRLMAQHQPYFVDYDEAGQRRIRRAYVVCPTCY